VWQWIRRNLPVLTQFPENELAGFYADLSRVEQWEQLADAVSGMTTPTADDLPAIIETIGAKVGSTDARPVLQPVFGGKEAVSGTKPAHPAGGVIPPMAALQVAVAGPHTVGREAQFSRAVRKLAAEKPFRHHSLDVYRGRRSCRRGGPGLRNFQTGETA
jgi:hypothetical protein